MFDDLFDALLPRRINVTRDADGFELPASMTSKVATVYVRVEHSPPNIGEAIETVYRCDEDGNWESGRDPYADGVFQRPERQPQEQPFGTPPPGKVIVVAGVRTLDEMRAL